MSGNSNTFGANVAASFDNLDNEQVNILYKEVLKEKTRRLLGKKVLADSTSGGFRRVTLDAHLYSYNGEVIISSRNCQVGP